MPLPDLEPDRLLGCISLKKKETRILTAFSVGYELQLWRYEALCDLIFEYLPRFALRHSDQDKINSLTAMSFLREAAKTIYQTDKYGKRGEFGELILHAVLERSFLTIPAVSKIFYKDGPNDTVKGFDAVHVVSNSDRLELWLGEVKFYKNISSAIRDVVTELEAHSTREYLRNEFPAITNKLEKDWPHYERLKLLLHPETSLDQVFDQLTIPVLLTYESSTVQNHDVVSREYVTQLREEVSRYEERFAQAASEIDLTLLLILLPIEEKEKLVNELHRKLIATQNLSLQ